MPRISVHIDAESIEEFRELIAMFHVKQAEAPPVPLTDIQRSVLDGTFAVASAPPPVVETPAAEPAAEPATEAPVTAKKVGRPRKAKEAPEVPVEPAVAPAPVPPAAAPAGNGTGATATRQDLLDVFAEYVQRYGANFGYTDISGLLQKTFGEGVRKASDVPEASLAQAISAIRVAIADNPFNRKRDYA